MIRRLFLALAFAVAAAGAASAQEVIHSFDSLVGVARNGTLTVTETIRVRAEGREIRRGIYRDFPLTFRDAGGREREVTFRLIDVLRDGKPEPHFTKRQGNVIRIYAGQEDVLLARGNYTYTFIYETGRQIRWFDGAPELNWNVTGNFWIFPIARATVRVQLPDGARPTRWTAFTGAMGERGTNFRGDIDSGGDLFVETTHPLNRYEGLTVVAAIPEGAVLPPGRATELWYMFLDNRNWILGGLGFLLVLTYYGMTWNAVGRDPKGGTIIPLFQPPEKVSPALASYIYNWGFSREPWRAFTAAAISLAVRGLLLFDDKDDTLRLKVTRQATDAERNALPPGEEAILNWVGRKGGNVSIDRANGEAVAKAGEEFRASIERENRNRFFRRNLEYFFIGLGLTALVIVGLLAFGGLQESDYVTLILMGFAGIFFGLFLIPVLRALFGITTGGFELRNAIRFIVIAGFLVYFGFNLASELSSLAGRIGGILPGFIVEHPFPFALVLGFTALNGLFLYLLRAPTDIGRKMMDQLEGFRLYLTTAETPRLNMEAPEITAERFEALLPYAVALDAEKPWSDAFAAALKRAYPGDDAAQHYQPRWHSGSNWSGSDFGRSIGSTVSSAAGAFASAIPPSSSGSSGFSSGGGGSGGGGGGGGGGGW